jgi:protein-arginine kinase activator protein McsA
MKYRFMHGMWLYVNKKLLTVTVNRDDDLEAIKLLKRKLVVAIREEDYKVASSIRDHPFLLLYKELFSER